MAEGAALGLCGRHRAGLEYLLAQSPDTAALVPHVPPTPWDPLGARHGVQMWKCLAVEPEKVNRTRGVGVIDAPVDFVANVILFAFREWDSTMCGFKTLTEERDEATGATIELSWSRYNFGVGPIIKDRDFVYWEVSQRLANGVHLIYGESLADEAVPGVEGIPSHKNVVRGTMGPSGWVVAPHNDGRQSCVTYISVTDLKITGVPTFLVNKFTEDVPLTIHDVRKVVMAKLSHACQSKRPDGACQ